LALNRMRWCNGTCFNTKGVKQGTLYFTGSVECRRFVGFCSGMQQQIHQEICGTQPCQSIRNSRVRHRQSGIVYDQYVPSPLLKSRGVFEILSPGCVLTVQVEKDWSLRIFDGDPEVAA